MVFKHGLIPLHVHSWLTANLAATLCRQNNEDPEAQALAWHFGLIHDAGVLSLQRTSISDFDHTRVSESEVQLLLQMIEERYNIKLEALPPIDDLISFAHFHAFSHIRFNEARKQLDSTFEPAVVKAVIDADHISTGREKYGFQNQIMPIFNSFSTGYIFDSPFRRLNFACFVEHAARLSKFGELISQKAREIEHETGIPRYDPMISESTWAIEYYLPVRDREEVESKFQEWLETRQVQGSISSETRFGVKTIRTRQTSASGDARCIICGREGRFYQGIKDSAEVRLAKKALKEKGEEGTDTRVQMGRGDVSRVLGFELDTWRGEYDGEKVKYQDHRNGICDACASALNNRKGQEGLFIFIPRAERVFELYPETEYRRLLKWWEEKSEVGLCSPDPFFFNLQNWMQTPDYSQTIQGLDERRALYEQAQRIFRDTVNLLTADDRQSYGLAELTPEIADRLKTSTSTMAPLAYGSFRSGGLDRVVVNGHSLETDVGALALHLIVQGARIDPSQGLVDNLKRIWTKVRLPSTQLDLLVEEYQRIAEALSM